MTQIVYIYMTWICCRVYLVDVWCHDELLVFHLSHCYTPQICIFTLDVPFNTEMVYDFITIYCLFAALLYATGDAIYQ